MLLDTGSTFSYMDAEIVAALGQQFEATLDEQQGIYYVSCSYLNGTEEDDDDEGSSHVHFGFNQGGVVIDVKYEDFIVDLGGRCALGVQSADVGATSWVLGDTFIRGAYSTYNVVVPTTLSLPYSACLPFLPEMQWSLISTTTPSG